jgi:cytochrome c-type biogenesis protein CcmH
MIRAMPEPTASKRRISSATVALAAAGLFATAAIGIVALRSSGGDGSTNNVAAAVAQQPQSVEEMIAGIEARVRQNPDNPEDFRLLGWSYFELARRSQSDETFRTDVARAADAYRRAAQLEPNNAENWSSLGEVLQVTSTEVSPEAEQAFQRALRIDPRDPRARYFTAVHKDLRGQHQAAIEDWLALLRDTPPGAPWEADLRRTIQQTAERHHIDIASRMPPPHPPVASATAAIPGPSREQMEAARSIPPSQQDAMVRGMVDGLANRLRQNPRDADGWIRLMRSRMVLNDPNAAREALRSGLAAFQGDAATQQRLRSAATELGIPTA